MESVFALGFLSGGSVRVTRLIELVEAGEDVLRQHLAQHERRREAVRDELGRLDKIMFLDNRNPKMLEDSRLTDLIGQLQLLSDLLDLEDGHEAFYGLRFVWAIRPGPQHMSYKDAERIVLHDSDETLALNTWAGSLKQAYRKFQEVFQPHLDNYNRRIQAA